MTPRVSVVIPSFNHGRFLGRALRSLLDQTYASWEAIVVDNHSTDDTDAVVHQLADSRIRLCKIRNDGVIAASRNRGIREAGGEWIAFLDSDDWWTPEKLGACLAQTASADLVYHQLRVVREDGSRPSHALVPSWPLRRPAWRDLVLRGNAIANSSVLVRARLLTTIGGFREDRAMVACEDFNAWIRIARITDGLRYVPEPLGFYLEHDAGMSHRDMSVPYAAATSECIEWLRSTERRRLRGRIAYVQGRHRYLRGDYRGSRAPLSMVLRAGSAEARIKAGYMLLGGLWPVQSDHD